MNPDSETPAGWNTLINSLPGAHILQTWQWGQFKAMYGWRPIPDVWRNSSGEIIGAGLVLERSARLSPFGPAYKVLYVPRGPLVDWNDPKKRLIVLDRLQDLARQERAIFLKIDPEILTGTGIPESQDAMTFESASQIEKELHLRGWQFSQDQIQFRNSVWLDLTGSETEWLARMKPKTRYNIRLAEKKGVVVRKGGRSDLQAVYRMYAETSVRDGFVIRPEEYYLRVWNYFMDAGMAEVLLAEVSGEMIAGLILFFTGSRAWYLYGMSRQSQREKMPNYLLQWRAMQTARDHGCTNYDLWGAPDQFTEDDPMWGVFRFKEGLGGQVVRFIGAWDYAARPNLYRIYTRILPKVLSLTRKRGKEKVRREVSV